MNPQTDSFSRERTEENLQVNSDIQHITVNQTGANYLVIMVLAAIFLGASVLASPLKARIKLALFLGLMLFASFYQAEPAAARAILWVMRIVVMVWIGAAIWRD
jgi:hypothetical protein